MSAMSDRFRADATLFRNAANDVLKPENAANLAGDIREQIAAVVGKVASIQLDAMADLCDYLDARPSMDERTAKRKAVLEKNDAIRRAAATGDWATVDKLAGIESGAGSP